MDELKPLPKHCGPIGADRCIYCGRTQTDYDVARCGDTIEAHKRSAVKVENLSPAGAIVDGVKMMPGKPQLPDWVQSSIAPENSRAASGGDSASLEQRAQELPDDISIPLDSLHADAGYLAGRVAIDGCAALMVAEEIRKRVDIAKAAITAALANQQGVGGWRFSKVSGGRDGDAWEIYDDTGSGGVVSTHDVKDWLVRKLLDNLATKQAAPAVEIIGEIVRAGDDEEGQPRIVVRTTRLAIQAIAVNPIGLSVRVTATQPAGDVGSKS